MDDVVVVQVDDSLERLCEKLESLWLGEDIFAILVVEKVSGFCVLHDHVNILCVIEGVPDLDDVGVVDFGVELYLPFYKFDFGLGGEVG